jgi:cytochrome c2
MKLLLVSTLLFLLQGCSPSGTDAATGERVFKQCASCHQVGVNAHGGFAPQLNGLFGRRAGSTPDFAYSDAMKRSGIVWNERTLAAFLRDPDKPCRARRCASGASATRTRSRPCRPTCALSRTCARASRSANRLQYCFKQNAV